VVGLLEKLAGGRKDDAATKARAEALKQWMDLNVPDPEDQKLYLQQLKSQGILTPELEQNILQNESEMKGIALDPKLREAQMSALSELQDIGQSGGMRLSDKAALEGMMGDINADITGREQALRSEMARRGMAGSGMELAQRQMAQQAAAQRAHMGGLTQAGMAQDRALQALMQAGQMGGNIRQQDFGEQAQIAAAQDAINRFNTANQIGTQQRNVGSRNYAQERNLDEAQRIADANVGIGNSQQQYNKELLQQEFANKAAKAAGVAGQYNKEAAQQATAGDAARNRWSNIGGGLGRIGAEIFAPKSAKSQWEDSYYKNLLKKDEG